MEPSLSYDPALWKYDQIRPLLFEAGDALLNAGHRTWMNGIAMIEPDGDGS